MSLRSRTLLLLASAALFLTLIYLLVGEQSPRMTEGDPVRESKAEQTSSAAAVPLLEVGEPEASDSRRAAVDSGARSEPVERPRREALPIAAGRLRVRAIDSESREPLDRIRVRAVSRTRIAERQSDRGIGEVELVLTPDTYSSLVSSPGYEMSEVGPVQIARGETVVLEPVLMHAGSARILGLVIGMHPYPALRVELLGDRRRSCPRCATEPDQDGAIPPQPAGAKTRRRHCPTCGYAEKSTHALVANSGRFSLDRLVSGPYAIRLIDPEDRTIGIPKFVELRAEESLLLEMDCATLRPIRVELIDTDGRSLAAEWAGRLRARTPPGTERAVEFVPGEGFFSPLQFQCTFRAENSCLARSVLVPPPKEEPSGTRPSPFGGRRLGSGPRKEKTTDDRSRRDSESLRPEARMPGIEPSDLISGVDPEGLAHFDLAPSLPLILEMKCGPFTATAMVQASEEMTRVRAPLTRETPRPAAVPPNPVESAGTFLEFEARRSR